MMAKVEPTKITHILSVTPSIPKKMAKDKLELFIRRLRQLIMGDYEGRGVVWKYAHKEGGLLKLDFMTDIPSCSDVKALANMVMDHVVEELASKHQMDLGIHYGLRYVVASVQPIVTLGLVDGCVAEDDNEVEEEE